MTREQAQQKVVAMMAEIFELPPEKITPGSRLVEELGLDSIDIIDMVTRLQAMTGRRVNDAALKKVRTVGDVIGLVQDHFRLAAA